jgi:hypothetical protein
VSSLGKILAVNADIFLCNHCSHCQTSPSIDLYEYYSTEYKTLSGSFDEDDLYEFVDEEPVYRNQHMANILYNKFLEIDRKIFENGHPILDFGCGKSLSMKHIMRMSNKEDIYLYDVSQDYIKFWDSFVPQSQYSCFELPNKWESYFYMVSSFFSLEHVADPIAEMTKISNLLKENGYVYIIVPNMYSSNIADMLVIDHVQHYSEASMDNLLRICGFEMVQADHISHSQGSIYIAKKVSRLRNIATIPLTKDYTTKSKNIAITWKAVKTSIADFENRMHEAGVTKYLIAGAGFLATYLYLQLEYPEKLIGFIDSNYHKQRKGWQNKRVIAPGLNIWDNSTAVLCGFNLAQIITILPKMLPDAIPEEYIWSMNKITK